ncbi:hypothetical protein Salat_2996000 [Sesamum alatum]|uniref:Uncharacterized protein n=1 Tax=Sesamum alatum TaxID=300844 RepID=A0AAE1XHS6_9LAMI|nr:hypothetical protein Salat_2996000 [Sesamum alatum]
MKSFESIGKGCGASPAGPALTCPQTASPHQAAGIAKCSATKQAFPNTTDAEVAKEVGRRKFITKKTFGVVGIDLTGLLITGIGSIYALFSVDMAEAHALTLRKGSDLAFSLQLSSLCMYEKRFISGLESFHSQKSSTDRSLRPIVSDVQQLLMSYHSWSSPPPDILAILREDHHWSDLGLDVF